MKKKSGLHIEQSVRIMRRFISVVDDVIDGAIMHKITWKDIASELNHKVYGQKNWYRLPSWARDRVRGHIEARVEEIKRYWLGWVYIVDGEAYDWETFKELPGMRNENGMLIPRKTEGKGRFVWLAEPSVQRDVFDGVASKVAKPIRPF